MGDKSKKEKYKSLKMMADARFIVKMAERRRFRKKKPVFELLFQTK